VKTKFSIPKKLGSNQEPETKPDCWMCVVCGNFNELKAERCLRCRKIHSGRDVFLLRVTHDA